MDNQWQDYITIKFGSITNAGYGQKRRHTEIDKETILWWTTDGKITSQSIPKSATNVGYGQKKTADRNCATEEDDE